MSPRATYRLQFHAGFTFADAEKIVPYLRDLGVSHLYASPILAARPGSTHGYDVVDPTRINPELGGEEGLRRLAATLEAHGLGLIVDIVPNHMGVSGTDNPYWVDVLRHGRASRFATFFDIDWETEAPGLAGRVLLPVLGQPYGAALEAGEFSIERDPNHGWVVGYFDQVFPVREEDAQAVEHDEAGARLLYNAATAPGRAALHALLERQHFRLAYWRTAGDLINWRRFFDVNELATLRADEEEVFAISHDLVVRLYEEGIIDGLRVDHVDGLAYPGAYCRRLRAALTERTAHRPPHKRERAYLVVEKILSAGEALDPYWQTDGTTGYDFMNDVSAVQHDPDGLARLAADFAARTGRPESFAAEEHAARREILARGFSAQWEAAVSALFAIAASDLAERDRTRPALRRALTEILAHFPRYRTYAAGAAAGEAWGAEALQVAIEGAQMSAFPGDLDHIAFIAAQLAPPAPGAPNAEARRLAIRRFEQLCAPLAAKATEDTAFYRHGPLLSRRDVGFHDETGDPVGIWHAAAGARATHFPLALLATATHDHKRGEDVRARLAVISERPQDFVALLDQVLPRLAEWRAAQGAGTVDPADDIMLVQMLLGVWPLDGDPGVLERLRERLAGWQRKALREAKLRSAWDAPNEAYEAAAEATLSALLKDDALASAREPIAAFARAIAPAGLLNALVQVVLKLTAPGVPDFYQGTEFLDFSLVDPDNRRPVDFAARIARLAGGTPGDADGLKQEMIAALLADRAAHPALYAEGAYVPLEVSGPRAHHVIAFARTGAGKARAIICPRLCSALLAPDGSFAPDAFADTTLALPDGYGWRAAAQSEALPTGTAVPVAMLLTGRPAAVLWGEAA